MWVTQLRYRASRAWQVVGAETPRRPARPSEAKRRNYAPPSGRLAWVAPSERRARRPGSGHCLYHVLRSTAQFKLGDETRWRTSGDGRSKVDRHMLTPNKNKLKTWMLGNSLELSKGHLRVAVPAFLNKSSSGLFFALRSSQRERAVADLRRRKESAHHNLASLFALHI